MADVLNPMPGMAVAVDADMPSAKVEITVQGDALPAGGNAGDVLTKTENGAEWKGIFATAGGYYTPSVSENGDLSWTASKSDMPAVEPVNIKGSQGEKGDPGSDATVTNQNITSALGYTPADKAVVDQLSEENEELKNDLVNNNITTIPAIAKSLGIVTPEFNYWWALTEKNKHFVIPISGGELLQIQSANSIMYFACLKTYTVPTKQGDTVDFSEEEGWTSAKIYGKSDDVLELTLPTDGKYLAVVCKYEDSDFTPTVLKIDGYNYLSDSSVKAILEVANKVESNCKINVSTVFSDANKSGKRIDFYPQKETKVKVYGEETFTVHHCGKNMLPFPYYFTQTYGNHITVLGIKIDVAEDGTISFNGTATETLNYEFANTDGWLLPKGDYVIHGNIDNSQCYFVIGGGTDLAYTTGKIIEFSIPDGATSLGNCLLQIPKGAVVSFIIKPMIEYYGQISDYEKYNGEKVTITESEEIDAYDGLNVLFCDSSITVEYADSESNKTLLNSYGNPLNEKVAIFDGDSICYGANDNTGYHGWASRICAKNHMRWKNYAVSGGTITSECYVNDKPTHWIAANVDTMYSEMPDADYIIFEGGVNDADIIGNTTSERFGTVTDGDYSGNYDINTFCGAFETMLYKAISNWKGKKIGYVVAMKQGTNQSSSYVLNRKEFFDKAMEICKKWGVPYLNLWDYSVMNPDLKAHYDSAGTDNLYADGQHPTASGYEYLYPIVEEWMRTL